jgi:hypothetical protein
MHFNKNLYTIKVGRAKVAKRIFLSNWRKRSAILVGQLIISASPHNNLALARAASHYFFWYFSNADSARNSFEKDDDQQPRLDKIIPL